MKLMLGTRRLLVFTLFVLALSACEDSDHENDCRAVDDGEFGGRKGFIHKCGEPPADQDAGKPRDERKDAGSLACDDARDCGALYQDAPGCILCADGNQICPEPECREGRCGLALPRLCPELEPQFACETDADCECKFHCYDSSSACSATRCEAGTCKATLRSCGIQTNPCTTLSHPFLVCTKCDASGVCAEFFPLCPEPCVENDRCEYPRQSCFDPGGASLCFNSTVFGCKDGGT